MEDFLLLEQWLVRASRWKIPLALCGLALFAVFLRCLRLLVSSSHYLYSTDSYYFHWVAQRVMVGLGPPPGMPGDNYTIQSGLAYPLAYFAKGVGFLFHLSPDDSLRMVSIFIPLAIAVVSMLVLYITVAKFINRQTALFTALTWALIFHAIFFGLGGYIDRDGLTVLLLMTGAIFFYLSKGWRFNIGKRDIGWILSGFGVLFIEALLYLEWNLIGSLFLIGIMFVYFVFKFILEYVFLLEREPSLMRRIATASKKLELRAFILVVVINIVIASLNYHQSIIWLKLLVHILSARFSGQIGPIGAGSAEMQGISFIDLLAFGFFLITIAIGLGQAWKQRHDAIVFFASWFFSFLILGLFIWRFLFLSTPAACVVSGVGMAYLWGMRGQVNIQSWKKIGVVVMTILMFIFAFYQAGSFSADYRLSANRYWQDALAYVKENTPNDAIIMTQWSHGYWILDLAQREPFVDNGYYGNDEEKLHNVGLVYTTTDPKEAAQIMKECKTDYLIFCKHDLEVSRYILHWAFPDEKLNSFSDESLIVRSLNEDFVSGDGLEVVFRNPEVVILQLSESFSNST